MAVERLDSAKSYPTKLGWTSDDRRISKEEAEERMLCGGQPLFGSGDAGAGLLHPDHSLAGQQQNPPPAIWSETPPPYLSMLEDDGTSKPVFKNFKIQAELVEQQSGTPLSVV